MKIAFTKFAESLSVALDYAEKALLDIEPYHGMRVAVISGRMAAQLGFEGERLLALTQAASLHDCALSEYFSDEMSGNGQPVTERNMSTHCNAGEEILRKLPLYESVQNTVLYHHERADGLGAMGMTAEDTPLCAQIVHFADALDVQFNLYHFGSDTFNMVPDWINENRGSVFTDECADAFLKCVDEELLQSISGEGAKTVFHEIMPERMIDVSLETLRSMASVFADITDYKSHFTWRHSMGIAQKAENFGRFYNFPDEECDKLFVAGALHDIGKLITDNAILHKEGKLSPEEYSEIQFHAKGTWDLLHEIEGLEDITRWAAYHHETLNGEGYPFGLKADQLDRNSRLMACLDVYQALTEERPYKPGFSHENTMEILRKLGNAGRLDMKLVDDVDACFRQ